MTAMTTQELVKDVLPAYQAPTTYSEVIRDEVKAECGRRGISQRQLARVMGLAQPSVSDRWRGRIPWTLDEVERLERVLGLDRGALLFRCARRDSNPQPSDLSPLQVLFAIAASADVETPELDDEDEYRRGQCVVCSGDCEPGYCIMFDDLVATTTASGPTIDIGECWCLVVGCKGDACDCPCHGDIDDLVATTAAAAWELAA